MRSLFIGALLSLAPVSAPSQPISGTDVADLVRDAMQQAGLVAPKIAPPLRAFPPCAHDPIVTARNGDWSQAQLDCNAPRWWRRFVRTDAEPQHAAMTTDTVTQDDDTAVMILVAARPLVRGQRISAADVRLVAGNRRLGSLDADQQIDGRRLRVALMADQPVLERHLDPDFDVNAGQDVTLHLISGGIEIGLAARAQENGWIGDKILVQPWNSPRTVQAAIVAKGILQVIPNIPVNPAVNR
jgi:flagellar basal body P-ring formation protein FlgA